MKGIFMISLFIEDIKLCMNGLLKETVFDSFLLHSLELDVLHHFAVDGAINQNYLNEVEKEERNQLDYISWKEIRPLITEIIKSHRTPLSMQIHFILSPASVEKVLKNVPEHLSEVIQSFSFRLQFENNQLRLITATNYKGFLPDKSAEHNFDNSMKQFLSHYGYVFIEE